MKNPTDYKLSEIKKIWHSFLPGSLAKAFNILYVKQELIESKLRQIDGNVYFVKLMTDDFYCPAYLVKYKGKKWFKFSNGVMTHIDTVNDYFKINNNDNYKLFGCK